jgi:hypothetical protein
MTWSMCVLLRGFSLVRNRFTSSTAGTADGLLKIHGFLFGQSSWFFFFFSLSLSSITNPFL